MWYLANFISLLRNKENRSNEIISPKIALGKFLERSLSAAVFTVIKIASCYIIFWWKCGKSKSKIWHSAEFRWLDKLSSFTIRYFSHSIDFQYLNFQGYRKSIYSSERRKKGHWSRAVGWCENPGVPVLIGGHNLPPPLGWDSVNFSAMAPPTVCSNGFYADISSQHQGQK